MGQKKLIRFAELDTFTNVLQYPQGMAGKWAQHFGNNNAITLELACGKGEYAVGLAQYYPGKNFIGVDVKGNRLWVGAKKALAAGLTNVAFLRAQIDGINSYFAANEVSEIWITFPDPQLRLSKDKKRLTHPKFLRKYQQLLVPGGSIHLKTDSPQLYQFTKRALTLCGCTLHEDLAHVHNGEVRKPELVIKTHYEGLDIAGQSKVHYLHFSLPEALPGPEVDKQLHEEALHETA